MKTIMVDLKISLLMITVLAVLTSSCNKDNTDTPPPVEPKLGESFEGGIVFYIDPTGKHGLISSTADLSLSTAWWNGSFVTTNGGSTTDGSLNTNAIITAQGNSGSYAAKLCRDYKGGGKNDWFLPAKDQLNVLYSQKAIVGGF